MNMKPTACLDETQDCVICISSDSDAEVHEEEEIDVSDADNEYAFVEEEEEEEEEEEDDDDDGGEGSVEDTIDEMDENEDYACEESSDADYAEEEDDDSEYVTCSDRDESESNQEQSPPAKSRKLTEEGKIGSEKSRAAKRGIQGKGEFENLTLEHCKAYLRHYLLRLTGPKATLLERIQDHWKLRGTNVVDIYPESSFTINCTGDACKGDTVLFTQKVYKMNSYNSTTRSSKQNSIGKRVVAGRIIKESYGADKQQHTFTVEVLWTKGPKALPPLYPLIIKGRNLYRLKTLRQPWPNEDDRVKALEEKHFRGDIARSARMDRITGKKRSRSNLKANTGKNVSELWENHVLCELNKNERGNLLPKKSNKTTSMFDVHVSSAGTIIGKNGKNIKAITRASGAMINLRKDPSDSKIRIVEIMGSQKQIQHAAEKLKQSLVSKGFPPPVQR